MNKKNIRADFPFFSKEEPGSARKKTGTTTDAGQSEQEISRDQNSLDIVYVDNASTTQKPQVVIDAITNFYAYHNANVGRGVYPLAEQATQLYEDTREKVQKFIGARHASEIIFTKGATEGINLVAQTWALAHIRPGEEIVVSELEHHANLLPWQQVARITGAVLKFIPVIQDTDFINQLRSDSGSQVNRGSETNLDSQVNLNSQGDSGNQGDLDYSTLDTLITHKTKLIAVTHVSHALGTHVDIARIAAHAQRVGAKLLVDAAQSAPHQEINVQELGCDFLVFSGHKMLGPTGVGVLYIRAELHGQLQPYQRGGGMVHAVDWHDASWAKMPHLLEAGTPPIAQVIGLGAAIDYLRSLDRAATAQHEAELCAKLIEGLSVLPGVRILGPIAQLRVSGHLVSFVVEHMHAHDVAAYLGSRGICVRAGHHCAQPLATALCYVASVRVSFYLYNTEHEVNYIVKVLQELVTKNYL
jgi:cysteine desulfurase/selenocysteine lyase